MALEKVVGEAIIQENLKQFLLVLSVSLSVAAFSRTFARFREIPYTLLLVIVGLALALLDVRLINIPPEVTLYIFLPPLLFRTAWGLDVSLIKRDLTAIVLYAIFSVLFAIVGVSFALSNFAGFPTLIALFTGASLAATSPAPITSLFSRLGVERRIRMLVEGENLFNSAVAIGAFVLLMDFPLDLVELNLQGIIGKIAALVGIGLIIGGAISLGISALIRHSELRFLGRSLLLVSAYGTYLLAEELGGSGVVATITAGLILGNLGARQVSPEKQQVLTEFLGFVAFLVNSIVFLVIGDKINFVNLGENLIPIGIAIATVLITRAISIFGLGSLCNWLAGCQVNWREQTLLWWTGLRGSVSIALVLSLPLVLANRQALEATVFGVVLFTLLVQGMTTKGLLQKLGFLSDRAQKEEYFQAIARSVALSQILNHLKDREVINYWGLDPKFPYYCELVQNELDRLQAEIHHKQIENPQLQVMVGEQLLQELIAMETRIYATFVRAGFLSDLPPLILPEVLKEEKETQEAKIES